MKHLDDAEIQAYLDGQAAALTAEIQGHLRDCGTCRDAVDDYRQVYLALADDRFLTLGDAFARTVSERIALETIREDKPGVPAAVGVAILALIMSGMALYFLGVRSDLMGLFSRLTGVGGEIIGALAAPARMILPELNGGFMFVFFAVLVLTVFALADRLLLRYRIHNL